MHGCDLADREHCFEEMIPFLSIKTASPGSTSLRVLKLWDIDNPPQLTEVEELVKGGNYGIRMRFEMAAVSLERWNAQKERLGRFFAKGLCAELFCPTPGAIDLILLPQKQENIPQEYE